MEIKYNILSIILLLGAVQGFILSLALSHKRGNHKANQLLALLVFFYSIFILDSALGEMNFFYQHPQLFALFRGLPYIFGALHFLYVKKLISPEVKLSKLHLLHFGFFIIFRIYTFPFWFESDEYKLKFLNGFNSSDIDLFHFLSDYVMLVQGLFYMGCSLAILKRYSKKIQNLFSAIDKINLNWLWYLTAFSLFVWIVATVEFLFPNISSLSSCDNF